MIRTVLFWKIFCPGQKNFRQGFAKLKYRWLQSSRLKMSRYSLFCVYNISTQNAHKYKKARQKYRDILSNTSPGLGRYDVTHAPIRSVRTFFIWKLTAITPLQVGHLILIMPSTASGSASNNLLFLQHGQAT